VSTRNLLSRAAGLIVIAALVVASCGGTEEPAQQAPSQEAAPPVEIPSPPAVEPPPPATEDTTGKAAPKPPRAPAAPKAPSPKPAFTRTELQVGTGTIAQKGRNLSVHYTGWLYDHTKPDMKGRMFDSSRDRGPFNFQLGAGQVIPGWDQGFEGMKTGGRRRLIIPPSLGYGVDGAGGGIIPPNATLLFEMELLEVK
jgi:FKBP-type peptidyl-prolyl cis-trans isomerase FkpA